MEKIIYIGYYNSLNNNQKRKSFLPAVNKMNYIIETLDKKFQVNVLSVSESIVREAYPLTEEKLFNNSKLILLPTLKNGNIFQNLIQRILIRFSLIKYILKNTDKNTKVIVYHSLGYMNTIKFLKKVKKFIFILEVEEIYADVMDNIDEEIKKKELNFFKRADGYILSTKFLEKKININNKLYAVIHGTYKVEKQRNKKFKEKDGKIHIVYAGTLEPRKGAAFAINAAIFLNQNYHLHILGVGTQSDIKNIKKLILEVAKKTECIITYDGVKIGEDYIEFLQGCDIGLSVQNISTNFNETSFPSKILSYMSNGLRVVSVDIPAIKASDIGEFMYYYEKQSPRELARVIEKVDFNDNYDSREIISNLDKKFMKELFRIL